MKEFENILFKKEELHEDLLPYLENNGMFDLIRHPLVYSVPHYQSQNALMNKMYIEKSKYAKELLDEKDFPAYVFLHERPFRMNAFLVVKDKMKDKDYWELLSGIWTDSENIWQQKKDWIKLLTDKKRSSTKSMFMSDKDIVELNKLPNTFTVYRGYHDGINEEGLSFTLDKSIAERFSKSIGNKKKGKVLSREVNKTDVFAYTDERSEKEIIILK